MFDGQFYPFQPIQFMDGLLDPIIGAGARAAAALIDRTTGTNIGNMTANAGINAAWDGNTNQNSAASACSTNNTPGIGYCGKTFAVPTALSSVDTYGSNDQGYVTSGNPSTTLELYGKTGAAPSSATDGTLLGSVTFTDTANESGAPRTITSSDVTTYWDHGWVRVLQASGGGSRLAEIQMTGWIT